MHACSSFLTATHLHVSIRHPNVVRVGSQIFRSGHDRELDRPLISKGLVGPFSHGSNFFDGRNAIVGNEYLEQSSGQFCSHVQFAEQVLTLLMTVCPSLLVTKSLTELGEAEARWFPPMK